MPITLPTLTGKVDYQVERLIREIVSALNTLEASGAAGRTTQPAARSAREDEILARLAAVEQAQIAARAAESLAPTTPAIPGQPGLPSQPGPGGGSGLGIIGAGSAAPTVALPNLASVVIDYANAHPAELAASCLASGGNWAFMDGVVAALMAADPRVGYNGKRGDTSDPSEDAVSYYHGIMPPVEGSPNVYVIDIIGGHCGPNPVPAWSNVTTPSAAGAYMSSR